MMSILAIGVGWAADETITFSDLYSSNTTLDEVIISGEDFSLVFDKRDGGTATQYYTNGNAVRWYGGGTLTVSSSTKTIKKIEISFTQTANSISANVGFYSLSNSVGTWEGSASSVVFTQSGTTGHCRISSIAVTYDDGTVEPDPESPTATVSFSQNSGEVDYGTTVALSLNGEADGIKYTLDGNDPTSTSNTYNGPISITEETTIKAAAFNYGNGKYAFGEVSTASYTIKEVEATVYSRIKSLSADDVGKQFLLVCESKTAGMGDVGAYGASISLSSLSDGVASITNEQVVPVTLGGSEDAWTFATPDGNFLAWNTSNNGNNLILSDETGNIQWKVAFTGNNVFISNNASSTRVIRYNASSPRFACYTTAQTDIQLYRLGEPDPIVLPEVASVNEFNGLANDTEFKFTGTNLVAVAQNGQYLYAQDATGGMLIFGSIDKEYELGKKIPAGFTGKKATFYGAPEMINPAGLTGATETVEVSPIEVIPSEITLAKFGLYAVIKGATIDENGNIVVGDESITCYTNTLGVSIPNNYEGKTYDVYGICGYHNGTQFMPLEFIEVTVPEGPSYYLLGDFNSWNQNENYKFKVKAAGGYYLNDVEIDADQEFKIIKVENGQITWYGADITDGGSYYGINGGHHINITLDGKSSAKNFRMETAGINDFEISSDMMLTINRDAQLYMKGSYSNDNWATKTPLTKTDAGWTTTIELNAGTEFKFIDEWETWYGGGEVTEITDSNLGNSIPINGGNNFTVQQAGNYTFNVNSALTAFVVTKELVAHNITVASGIEHGTVTTDVASALAGEVITISVTPDDGYIPDVITVMAGETPVAMTGNTFVMPDADVTVSATFKQFVAASYFKLVTNINQLEAGKQILVVGKKEDTGVYVMNTTDQNKNNRKSTQINQTGVLPTYITYVEGYNALVLGRSGTYYTFYEVGNKGYLKAASSSNNNLHAGVLDKNAMAEITADGETFAVEFSISDYSRNKLRMNYNGGSPLFSCYGSGQEPIYLYVETEAVEYTITVAECENGRIAEVTAETATAGSDIYFTVVPVANYAVDAVSITTSDGANVEYESDDDIYSFVMPAADVTISATFKKVATVLEGVSFVNGRHWATWCGDEKLSMPTGVTAYVVTGVSNGKVQIAVKDVVNSGEGVLLYCESEMAEVTAAVATNATNAATNLLVGCLEPATVSDAYVLYNNNFVLVQNGTTVGAHRCYLPMNSVTQNAPMLRIAMPGTVTAIEDLRYDSNGKPVGYYDLTGRYIGTSLNGKRGIFITSDGKKVVR